MGGTMAPASSEASPTRPHRVSAPEGAREPASVSLNSLGGAPPPRTSFRRFGAGGPMLLSPPLPPLPAPLPF